MRSFREYLRYASKHLASAEVAIQEHANPEWHLIPSIILAWSAIEAFVNNRFSDLKSLPENMFELHERAFLLEKHLRFVDSGSEIGKFILEGNEYQATENKIFFLLSKLGSQDTSGLKGGELWQRFRDLKDIRDSLAHPRIDNQPELRIDDVRNHIETAKDLIQLISERIWKARLNL